jgi:hypothetical protein
MIKWIKLQLGLIEPETLVKDILLCGRNGGKYNTKYFFMLSTDENQLILDRCNLKVVDSYSHQIQSINYMGMDFRQFNKDRCTPQSVDLVETMKGLER